MVRQYKVMQGNIATLRMMSTMCSYVIESAQIVISSYVTYTAAS